MSSIRTPLTVSPHEYFGDATGRPLDYGTIYFGEPDKDPEFYPIDVYSDEALTQPIPQPIRTKGGFINVNGDIIEVYGRPAIYSVKVLDQYGRKIFYKGKAMRNNVNDDIIAEIDAAIQQSKDDGVEYAKKAVREAIDDTVTDGSPIADTMIAVDGSLSQRTINKGLESIADLSTIKNPKDGLRVYVKSYHAGLNKGGGYFTYDSSKAGVNDGGTVVNGWVRDFGDSITPHFFGAVCDGVTDDTNSLQDYITYLKTKKSPHFILPEGNCVVSEPIVIDLPQEAIIEFKGTLLSQVKHDVCLTIGGDGVNGRGYFYYTLRDIAVRCKVPHAENIATDTEKNSVALKLSNLVSSSGNIKVATGCYTGILVTGSVGNAGFSYCTFQLGYLKNNVKGIVLDARSETGSGYTNENTFMGGTFGHDSSFDTLGEGVNITVTTSSNHPPNNNLFFRPSLEANHSTTKAAVISGNSNNIFMPRLENSKNYLGFTIDIAKNSINCGVIGGGFGLKRGMIVNNGSGSKYTTEHEFYFSGSSSGDDPDSSIFNLTNNASNTGKVISVKNASSTERFYVDATGFVSSSSKIYAAQGIRWQTNNGSLDDRGLYLYNGSPVGTVNANFGSLCISTSDSSLYLKKSGYASSGWTKVQEILSSATSARPSSPIVGQMHFDTDLNKPVFYTGSSWVSADGTVV